MEAIAGSSAASSQLMAASSIASLFASMASTNVQASAQRVQAAQAELQGRQNALNYSRQANEVLRRQEMLSASARARAAAGGVNPFTGSALTMQQVNSMRSAEEFQIATDNAEMAIYGGLAQSQNLIAAADITQSLGTAKAVADAGTAYARFERVRTPTKEK